MDRARREGGADEVLPGQDRGPRSRGPLGARRSRRLLSLRDTARAMSQENVEIVRRAFSAFQGRDSKAWVNCFHPDVELLLPRNVLEGGSYRGHEGVKRALADAFETWETFGFDIQDVRTVD